MDGKAPGQLAGRASEHASGQSSGRSSERPAGRARPARVGIVDVAARAGVSRQTVSNVLNGRKDSFSPDTFDRVQAAMTELGYQPHRAAQTLRSQRSMQIAYHMFGDQLETMNGFFMRFLQALVRQAAQHDYQVLVFTHQDDALTSFEQLIARRSADAFILSESAVDDPRVRLLAERQIPFACMGRLAADLPQQWVDVDNHAGMQPLADHLVARGHRDIAFAGTAPHRYWTTERYEGLVAGLARHGVQVPRHNTYLGGEAGLRPFTRRLLGRAQPPSAIACSSDAVAALVVNVAHSLGRVVGEDLAVTGFDGGAVGSGTEPALTGVRIPIERIARELVRRCLREITHGPTGEPGLLVPTDLVIAGSA